MGTLLAKASTDEEGFYEGAIVLVNKCRQFVKDGEDGEPVVAKDLGRALNEFLSHRGASSAKMNGDEDIKYFRPVLEDDAVLMCIDELRELKSQREKGSQSDNLHDSNKPEEPETKNESEIVKNLQLKIELLEEQLSRAKACIASLANDDSDSDSCSDGEEERAANDRRRK